MATVDSVMIEIGANADSAVSGLEKLASALEKIKGVTKGGLGLSTVSRQIAKLSATLNGNDSTQGAQKITKYNNALETVRKTADAATSSLQKLNKSQSARTGSDTSSDTFGLFRTGMNMAVMYKVADVMSDAIISSNEYVENLNLFTVAMGEYADQALAYAERVQAVMGIDSSEWIRNQGIFAQIASGLGMAADQAYYLSQGLTQVAYDIASFYNISTEEAMQKVQSGIAGEIEPMRRLGYALDQATLQRIAYAHGIDMSVSSMTAAQKTELRYVAIMEQSKNAINDMSRTINTSANQMRIMQSQLTLLARAFGNVLIPAINAVLPVLISFVNTLASVLNAIANFFGFSLPTIDYSGMSGGLSDASDAAGDLGSNLGSAGGAAKKLKNTLMGFDELNVLQDQSSGGGGGGGGGIGGGSLGFDLSDYMYDFLDGLESRINNIWETLTPMQALIMSIATGLLEWGISSKLIKHLQESNTLLGKIAAVALSLASVGIMVTLVYQFSKKYLATGNITYLIADGLTTLLSTAVVGRTISAAFGAKAGWYSAAVTLLISAGTTIVATLEDVDANGFSGKTIGESVMAGIKGAVAGGIFAKMAGLSLAAGAGIGFIAVAGITLALAGLTVIADDGLEPEWGETSLTQEEIETLVHSLVDQEIVAKLSVVGAELEETQAFRDSLTDSSEQLKSTIETMTIYADLPLEYNPITEDQINSEVDAVISDAQALLHQKTITVNAMVQLFEAGEDGEPTDLGNSILENTATIEGLVSNRLTELGREMGEYVSSAFEDGVLDVDEAEIVQEYYAKISRITQAMQIADMENATANFVQENGLASLSQETFNATWDTTKAFIDEQTEAAKQAAIEYENALRGNAVIARELLADMTPQDADYQETFNAYAEAVLNFAKAAGYTDEQLATMDFSTVDSITAELEKITGIDYDAYIARIMDPMTAELYSYFETALVDIFGNLASENITGGLFDIIRADIASLERMQGAPLTAEQIANEFTDQFESALEAEGFNIDIASALGITGWDLLSNEARTEFYNMLSDAFGEGRATEVFAELGLTLQSEVSGAISDATEAANDGAGGLEDALSFDPDNSGLIETAEIIEGLPSDIRKTYGPAQLATGKLDAMGESMSAVAENAEALGNTTVSPTIALNDRASGTISTISSNLSRVRGTYTATLRVNASVSSSAGSISNSLATIMSGSSSSISSAFKNLYRYSLTATGGIPRQGTMFLAGESGPEIVGMVGSRTGVANREQISEIIAAEMARQGGDNQNDSIADLVVAALNNMELTVDGETLGRFAVRGINRYQRRTGRVELQI